MVMDLEGYGSPELDRGIEMTSHNFYDTPEEKMNKITSLLKFYKKEGIKIKFRLLEQPNVEIKGEILQIYRRNFIRSQSFVIIKNKDTPKVKVFLEEVDTTTILPEEIKVTPLIEFKRIDLPSKVRFDIIKRDKRTCQYCGREPPEVKLEIDHIKPVSKGGTNEPSNLITSCRDCNRGKTDSEI